MTHKVNSPPPPERRRVSPMTREAAGSERDGRGLPWHKPTLYELTDYLDTDGSPTQKDHMNDPENIEDENLPFPQGKKSYRPFST